MYTLFALSFPYTMRPSKRRWLMEDHNEKEMRDVQRLGERTKGLERADGRHYFAEFVLFIAVLALALLFVSGCRINTPFPNVGTEEEKEWVYKKGEVELEGITFSVGDDNRSLNMSDKKGLLKTFKTDEDSHGWNDNTSAYTVSVSFLEDEIKIYKDKTTLVGTFTYE